VNVDSTRIILEELNKLGDPLPIEITNVRPSGLFMQLPLAGRFLGALITQRRSGFATHHPTPSNTHHLRRSPA
jgi:hypothetical protein